MGAILWRDEGRNWLPDPPAAGVRGAVSAGVGTRTTGVRQEINARLAKSWPAIIQKKAAPEDADAWLEVKDKRGLLEE